MNKFIGNKLQINKWIAQAQIKNAQKKSAWTIFEKQYLTRSAEDLEKIGRVKDELLHADRKVRFTE